MANLSVSPTFPLNLSTRPSHPVTIANQGGASVTVNWITSGGPQTQSVAASASLVVTPLDGAIAITDGPSIVFISATYPGPQGELWVDPINGDDATAAGGARHLPYATFVAAYAASIPGQIIRLLPGTHAIAADLIVDKAIAVLGEPGAAVTGAFLWDLRADLQLKDVTFSGFGGIYLGNLASRVSLTADGCAWDSGVAGIYTPDATVPVITTGFTQCRIQNCRFTNLTDVALRLGAGSWDEVLIDGNVFNNVQRRAIQVGGNADFTYEAVRKKVVVTHNIIDGVSDSQSVQPAGNTVNGIIVYGFYGVISDNVVLNCTRVTQVTDCEGIYTKAAYSIISNNVVVDSGQGEASINIKGRSQNSYQTAVFAGFVTSDAFNITFDGQTTTNITYDATTSAAFQAMAAATQAALEALPNIGVGNILVTVAQYSSRTLSFEFVGTFVGQVVPPLTGAAVAPSVGTITWTYPQQHHGYATSCIGNTVRATSAAPFPVKGINIKCERVYVGGNRVEGATFGVSTATADECRGATIIANEIVNIVRTSAATAGIQILSNTDGVRIVDNRILGVSNGGGAFSNAGIKVSRQGDFVEIRGNVVSGVTGTSGTCIRINEDNDGAIQSCIVDGNRFSADTVFGIRVVGAVATMVVSGNTFQTTVASKMVQWTVVPTSIRVYGNSGLISDNRGQTTISVGSTTRNINHLLNLPTGKATASMVTLTLGSSAAATGMPWVSGMTDTQFTITVPAAPVGSPLTLYWQANAIGTL